MMIKAIMRERAERERQKSWPIDRTSKATSQS